MQGVFGRGFNRAATIRTAKWTLLNTVLITVASAVLYGLAVFAYLLFFHNYLPDQVSSVPIHLQYGYLRPPWLSSSTQVAQGSGD